MKIRTPAPATLATLSACLALVLITASASAQVGRRFPSEKKIVPDPVTGIPLTFLTSTPAGDSKIYQTHSQWTSDGQWLVFRSNRAPGQAFAVNEDNGAIVQLTEKGYLGMLCLARHSMKLYFMRDTSRTTPSTTSNLATAPATDSPTPAPPTTGSTTTARFVSSTGTPATVDPATPRIRSKGPFQIIELDLEKIFADSAAGTLKPGPTAYERVCGTTPPDMTADGNMGLDANEDFAYFRINGDDLADKLAPGQKLAGRFGPRGMGAGPTGLASMNLKTGEIKLIVAVGFQIGHVQTNPWVPGEIVFCWETGGKAPQRTWTVMADGTGLRPLYPEADYEWITHEAVISKDEVAFAIMGHRTNARATADSDWGISGTREHPTGLAIVNLRTREMRLAGQTPTGSGLWHVAGSADGRWAAGDDFSRSLYLIDRHTSEMILLTTGHKPTAADHPHPTFNADGTKIEIESAMLSADNRSMNICIVPVPKSWLARTYSDKMP